MLIPRAERAERGFFAALCRLLSTLARPVPATLPFFPALPRAPMMPSVVSRSSPACEAVTPAYFIASPRSSRPVAEPFAVLTYTSPMRPMSVAVSENWFIDAENTSAVSAIDSFVAAAACRMPGIAAATAVAFSMSPPLKFLARMSIPAAASSAEYFVVAPSSRAVAERLATAPSISLNCSGVIAFVRSNVAAFTEDICSSKSIILSSGPFSAPAAPAAKVLTLSADCFMSADSLNAFDAFLPVRSRVSKFFVILRMNADERSIAWKMKPTLNSFPAMDHLPASASAFARARAAFRCSATSCARACQKARSDVSISQSSEG